MKIFSIVFFLIGLFIVSLIQEYPWMQHVTERPSNGMVAVSLGLVAITCFICSVFLFYKGTVTNNREKEHSANKENTGNT